MKKKKVWIICSSVLLIGGVIITWFLLVNNQVEKFCVSDYQKYVDAGHRDEPLMIEPVTDSKSLKAQVETLWPKVFGQDVFQNIEKEVLVYYDPKNDAWLVKGVLPENYLGGVPYMIVQSNGKVLALWHTK